MPYRRTPAYAEAKARADADRKRQRGVRGTLANVGRNPLTLRARTFASVE